MENQIDIKNYKDVSHKICVCVSAHSSMYDYNEQKRIMENIFFRFENKKIMIFENYNEIVDFIESDCKKRHYSFYFIWLTREEDRPLSLLKKLKRKEINNFKILSSEDYNWLLNQYFEFYLKTKKCDISKDILKIGKFFVINPLKNNRYRFYLGDVVLPQFYNDYTMIDEGPYEYQGVRLKKGDVVFDCGAHIGSFSALALSKQCKVHAFEPIKDTYERLCENLKLYGQNSVEINNVGLSNKSGEQRFYIYSAEHDARNGMMFPSLNNNIEMCGVTTIDEYVKKNEIDRVDFIKADIEGAERIMLEGAQNTIHKFKPNISICTYHYEDDPQIIENLILNISNEYTIIHKWKKIYAYVKC